MQFTVSALSGMPMIQSGDDLVQIIIEALNANDIQLSDGDVLVVTSKIVSKSEGCIVDLSTVVPGENAYHFAAITDKDPRLVEVVLRESRRVSRAVKGVLIVEHRLGFISANAALDQSNLAEGESYVLTLPVDPDASAKRIHEGFFETLGVHVGIVISDSHGRPFRMGNVGVAIGIAGVPAVLDLRGTKDLFDRELKVTVSGYGDMLASTAQLVSGEGAEGRPVVLIRGLLSHHENGTARDLVRPAQQNLYQ